MGDVEKRGDERACDGGSSRLGPTGEAERPRGTGCAGGEPAELNWLCSERGFALVGRCCGERVGWAALPAAGAAAGDGRRATEARPPPFCFSSIRRFLPAFESSSRVVRNAASYAA